jgi:hypothetical protein
MPVKNQSKYDSEKGHFEIKKPPKEKENKTNNNGFNGANAHKRRKYAH